MTGYKTSFVIMFGLVLLGCGPSPEKISEFATSSMQQKFDTDPQFKEFGLKVIRVQVVKESDNRFQGIASIQHEGATHEVPVQITGSNDGIIWKIEPGALMFVAQKEFQKLQKALQ